MTTIRVHRHAAEGEPPREFQARSIGQWLLDHYGDAPAHGVFVYAGKPSGETDITGDVPALMRNDQPFYTVLEAPGTGIELGPLLLSMLVSTVINVALTSMFAPDKQTQANRAQESPNNALSERTNRVRTLQRVEDIFGTVRSVPSLLMPTYVKYAGNVKFEYAFMCIGRGYYDISDVREAHTSLADVNGSSARVYGPFTSPNSGHAPQLVIGDPIIDTILNVQRSSSVDSIVLRAANQIQLSAGSQLTFMRQTTGSTSDTLPHVNRDIIAQPANIDDFIFRRPNLQAIASPGQAITIALGNAAELRNTGPTVSLTVVGASKVFTSSSATFFTDVVNGQPISFGPPSANPGPFTVVSHTGNSVTVSGGTVVDEGPIFSVPVTMPVAHAPQNRIIDEVGDGWVTLTGAYQFPVSQITTTGAVVVIDNGLLEWTDWTVLEAPDRTQVWTNVLAAGGMFKDDGGSRRATSTSYEVQVEKLDASLVPTGVLQTATGNISGNAATELAETLEQMTGWGAGPVRVRARRTTPFDYDFAGFVQDEITLIDLFGVAPVTKTHFGNKTTIHTVTRVTASAAAVHQRELNCLASRLIPTYNAGTGTFSAAFNPDGSLNSGTLHPSSKIVDIIAAVTLDPVIGARSVQELDMVQIYGVQQQLDAWNAEAGQFNYTFDTEALSFEETVDAIANAGFCKPYRQNGQIRLALDRPQANSVALFTHRNKKPNAETITRRFANDSDYEGVELAYADPDTESQETIRLPLGGTATKLKKVEVSGIRSFTQAWLRANREYQRLRFERLSIKTEVTADGRALLPNSRIEVVDNTRFRSWDGEVVGQVGLEITLSRDVEFLPAAPHSIVLKKRDGSPQSVAVTAGGAANRVVLAGPPAEAIVTEPTPEGGVRTEFSFAADSARGAQAWLTQDIEIGDDGYVTVSAVNYSTAYYAADAGPIPTRDSVIN